MPEAAITIRPATGEDAPAIGELGREVFLRGHGEPYDKTAMNAYLEEYLGSDKIIQELGRKTVYYYVAVTDAVVGFVKFRSWVWTPRYKGKVTFEVERLYVRKDMEGQKIGSRLMALAIEAGRQKKYSIIWLSVWADNDRAIRFHQRNGFETVGDGVFTLGGVEKKYLVMRLKQ